jgi:TetR/AcrR family transcriptional repressor of nem operon
MPRQGDKRERLVRAGRELIYNQGFGRTTLADIAETSGVPLGNVYYYFRSKEELLAAVSDTHEDDFRVRAAEFDKQPVPRERLLAFLDSVIDARESLAEHGCPVGSLCQEMNKGGTEALARVNQGLILRAQWVSEQFREMGRVDAQELGVWLIGSVQGVILMANALRDPGVVDRQVSQLKAWIQAF